MRDDRQPPASAADGRISRRAIGLAPAGSPGSRRGRAGHRISDSHGEAAGWRAEPPPHVAPCLTRSSSISGSLSFRAQANGVAHGSSSGKLVAAPRFNRNSTIRRLRGACCGRSSSLHLRPQQIAEAKGLSLNSRPRALMSAPASRNTAATDRSPFSAQACR
jgi:hypothetical protein